MNTNSMSSKFNRMRQEGTMTDVVIKCGDTTFPAHKLVLAGSSPYFQAMFSSNMKESHAEEIVMQAVVEPEIFIKVLEFMYTETIDVTQDTRYILKAAEYLHVDLLSDMCCQHLAKYDHLAEAFQCWDIFEEYGKDMKQDIIAQLACKLEEVYSMGEFLELDSLRMLSLIRVSGEVEIPTNFSTKTWTDIRIQAAVNWVKHDLESRKAFLQNCVELINSHEASCSCLINLLESEVWITEVPSVTERFLGNILKNLWPRKHVTVLLYFVHDHSLRVNCVCFNDVTGCAVMAKLKTHLPSFKRTEVAHVFGTGCTILFFTCTSFSVFSFNLETQLWSEIAIDNSPFSPQTSILSCIYFQGDVYVLTEDKFIQYYDFHTTCRMEEKSPPVISSTVQRESLVEIGNKLYCIGGKKHLQEYDASNNKWHQVDFKSESKFVASLKDNTFFYYCEGSELYILTKDLLNLFIVSIPNNRFLSIRGVNLPNSIKQGHWLAFNVFPVSPKSNHFRFYLLDEDGQVWIRVSEGNFETWTKDKEVIDVKKRGTLHQGVNFFSVKASIHI